MKTNFFNADLHIICLLISKFLCQLSGQPYINHKLQWTMPIKDVSILSDPCGAVEVNAAINISLHALKNRDILQSVLL
jgi:hypothetical protein